MITLPALASEPISYEHFRTLPILHEGRIKPLDSFARIQLQQLGDPEVEPLPWLAQALFSPGDSMQQKLIRVEDRHLRQALQLPDEMGNRYSFAQVTAALGPRRDDLHAIVGKPEDQRSQTETQMLRLFTVVGEYSELLSSATLLLPLPAELSPQTAAALGITAREARSYLELVQRKETLDRKLKQIIARKGSDVSRYTPQEQELAQLSFALTNIGITGSQNQLLRVIAHESGEWQSLWGAFGAQHGQEILTVWGELAQAHRMHDGEGWEKAVQQLRSSAPSSVSGWKLELETWYHRLNPIMVSAGLYAFALILFSVQTWRPSTWLPKLAWSILIAGIATHLGLLLSRVIILSRPPVGTLYESVLFVSLVIVMLGALMGRARREAVFAGLGFASLLLLVSPYYAPEGDPMGVLVAVLNTNFWLATHVICITLGYGVTLLAGTVAHWYLFSPSTELMKTLKTTALMALLFTAVGTMLGGIWADQSWGRFWGWDPKENGALLIVLWLIWILHGAMTHHLHLRAFAALLAAANIIVALSWFGVNLLSVGLHSYGFTDSAALGLFSFCSLEVAFIAALYLRARRQHAP